MFKKISSVLIFFLITLSAFQINAVENETDINYLKIIKDKKGNEEVVINFVDEEYAGEWKYVNKRYVAKKIPVFEDVRENDCSLPLNVMAAVLRSAYHNIIGGYEDGTFRPEENITRAEFIAIVTRAFLNDYNSLLKNYEPENCFKDIKNHWAEININIAVDNNWINGYEDNTFRPNKNINHAEAVVILNRIAKCYGSNTDYPYSFGEKYRITLSNDENDNNTEILQYKGNEFIKQFEKYDWAYKAIKNFFFEGIISEEEIVDRYFNPHYNLTRAEAAVLIDAINLHFEEQRLNYKER
jgi:hypothetical protein